MKDVNQPAEDPLRQGLVLLCQELGREVGVAELGDGLPLVQGRLQLRDVPRALRRADVSARVIEWPLTQLSARMLPALLCLRDVGYLVLVRRDGDDAILLEPLTGGGELRLSLDELSGLYSGMVVVARAKSRPDARVADMAGAPAEHWLYTPLRAAWPALVQISLAAMLANLLSIGSSLFAMQVYDRVVPSDAFDTLWILASGVGLALVMDLVLRVLRAQLLDATGKRLDMALSSRLFGQALSVRLAAKPASTGVFSSQLREFDSVREFFTSTTAGTLADVPFVLLFIGLVAVIGGPLAWVPAVGAVTMLVPGLLAQGRLSRLSRQHLQESALKNAMLLESIENLEAVKATRAEGRLLQQWETLTADIASTAVQLRSWTNALMYGGAFVQQLTYAAVVVHGAYRISAGEMTVGGLVACSILASRALAPLAQLASLLARWQQVKVALEGLDRLMQSPVERPAGRQFSHRTVLTGQYQLDDVVLRYSPDGAPALDIRTLTIAPGERVALLGNMGAGKSTLLRLLAGIGDAQQGRVSLDGLALTQIDPIDRRNAIGYLPQDTTLFHGTLRDNLNLDQRGVNDDERMATLEMVGLGPFVRQHPLGLDMPIFGSGSLSGGQRQAIGLARLILQDPRVVLLDEPTSSFDQASEQHVINALKPWLQGRTLVLSTHKRNLLALVSRAVVLQQGRVAMDGPLPSIVQGHEVVVPTAVRVAEEQA